MQVFVNRSILMKSIQSYSIKLPILNAINQLTQFHQTK